MIKFENDNDYLSKRNNEIHSIENEQKDISAVIDMYNRVGYQYFDIHIDFLEKYYGTNIQYKHPYWGQSILIKVNPIESQSHIDMEVVEYYNQFFNEKLVLVAEIEQEYMDIFLSDKGTFYGCFDETVIEFGDDFERMISMLREGKKGIYHFVPLE